MTLKVAFTEPPGQKLDDSFGPPIQVSVGASPASLLRSGAGDSGSLSRELILGEGEGVLTVIAQVATCDAAAEYPACHLTRQDWGIPFRTVAGAPAELTLPLFQRD